MGLWSKTVRSLPAAEMPWMLRRFATGLPKLAWPRLIVASLRFSGLTEIAGNGSLLDSRNLDTPAFEDDPETSTCTEWREGRSRSRRVAGLSAIVSSTEPAFSWPKTSAPEAESGAGLPESGAAPKTRFTGLLGDTRDRERGRVKGLADRVERTESLRFGLIEALVGSCGAEKEVGEGGPAGAAGVAGAGTGEDAAGSGCAAVAAVVVVAAGVGDWRKTAEALGFGDAAPDNLNLEGDRESDLRSDRTAVETSTW